MKIKKGVFILLTVISLGLIAGCSSKNKSEDSTVRVAFFANLTHSQALIGKEQGVFQQALGEGNKVIWKQFNSGSSELEALLAGEVDIGYIGPSPAINGYVKSKGEIQIISGAADAGAILVSRKGLLIRDIKELSDKKIAIPQYGNTQDLSLRNLIQEAGLKDKTKGGTVDIVQANNSDIKTLLDQGEIDAALVPEPWGARLVKEIGANVVLDFDKVWRDGKYSTTVLVVRKEYLRDHPDVVEKFLRTHIKLTDYINENQDEAKKLVNKQIVDLTKQSLPDDVLDASFRRLTITNNPESEAINDMVQLSVKAGYIRQQPNIDNLLNLDLLNKVLQEKEQQQIQ
ncbi:sulfate ABC transporter substrate-binding protein [Clostridium polyendosporum]|uniref:Sulfate ABC transporter substrate-binding protein n=1 Tax=Clostridium polyendosporum TaxID=69208 RepID=A0A919VFK9_9CLOT|nr:aliphatic sulfonate ABC transporter substrate-binding protein [Clostridium polyendosporum]GIM28262.1 sulfate ABC transporter substrate-binding protein [Clostridium polyendosporum]